MYELLDKLSHHEVCVSVRKFNSDLTSAFEVLQVDAGDHHHVHTQFFNHPLNSATLMHGGTDVHYVVKTRLEKTPNMPVFTMEMRNKHGVNHRVSLYFHDDDAFSQFMKEMIRVYAATA